MARQRRLQGHRPPQRRSESDSRPARRSDERGRGRRRRFHGQCSARHAVGRGPGRQRRWRGARQTFNRARGAQEKDHPRRRQSRGRRYCRHPRGACRLDFEGDGGAWRRGCGHSTRPECGDARRGSDEGARSERRGSYGRSCRRCNRESRKATLSSRSRR